MSDSSQENPQELLTPWNITVEEAGRFKKNPRKRNSGGATDRNGKFGVGIILQELITVLAKPDVMFVCHLGLVLVPSYSIKHSPGYLAEVFYK